VPGRRIPQPSLLRSHPRTEDRVARLRDLADRPMLPHLALTEEPMLSLIGLGPAAMRPRYRWTGVWF
jgi:heat shock protein HtpX